MASGGHALHHVVDVAVGAVEVSFGYDGFGDALAHTLDGHEAEAYVAAGVDAETYARLVDVGAEHVIFMLLHSSMKPVSLVMSLRLRLSTAAMYSGG